MPKSKTSTRRHSNFWSGLSLGLIAGAVGLYIMGTKKGRASLRNLLDGLENWEDIVEDLGGVIEGEEVQSSTNKNKKNTITTVLDKIQETIS